MTASLSSVMSEGNCAICKLSMKDSSDVVAHSNGDGDKHPFHKTCLEPWLKIKDTCPVCKTPILSLRDRMVKKIKLMGRDLLLVGAIGGVDLIIIKIVEDRFTAAGVAATLAGAGAIAGLAGEVRGFAGGVAAGATVTAAGTLGVTGQIAIVTSAITIAAAAGLLGLVAPRTAVAAGHVYGLAMVSSLVALVAVAKGIAGEKVAGVLVGAVGGIIGRSMCRSYEME